MSMATAQALAPGSAPVAQATPIVFVVDDDVSVRESLEMLIDCVGLSPECFASADDFLARPRPSTPSCLVLDMNLAGLSGLDLQEQVAADRTEMPIIFITACVDVAMTVRAMKAGALDLLTKPFRDEVLMDAIQQAIERSRAALEDARQLRSLRDRYASLTCRQREVMVLVVAGLLNKQIADELELSEITVKAHRGNVTRKMKARSVPSLVSMAARLGLPGPRP